MNKVWMLIFGALFSLSIFAQQKTEYNSKGDEAMTKADYSDARLYYEEGVFDCDMYSINQLTNIWLIDEPMRSSMRGLMSKCLKCLNEKAASNDSVAISRLITYYAEGIGTPSSEDLATYWTKHLEKINKPVFAFDPNSQNTTEESHRMAFFAGYSFSITTPVGVTIGGMSKQYGWYARFKSNMSFQEAPFTYSNGRPENVEGFFESAQKKHNTYLGTAGLVVKYNPKLFVSVGLGYGSHTLLYAYNKLNDGGDKIGKIWCKNTEDSFKGIVVETDVMYKLGSLYLSAGCNTLTFKYVDLNAGVGVFF